jgi:acetylglutamate kinase
VVRRLLTSQDHSRVVLKLGGRALESADGVRELAIDLAELAPIVVHGGGAEVSEWSRRLGLEPKFVDGLRVTDEATLAVATAVLAGLANKRMVAQLQAAGVNAVGLSAVDGGTVQVTPHPDAARLGQVGAVEAVRTELLQALLELGFCPVLASIGARNGELINLNADDVAAAIAGAFEAHALFLLSDTPGVRLSGAIVPEIPADEISQVLGSGDVEGGMVAKLHAAARAIRSGVREVHIAAWSGPGTLRRLLAGELETTRIASVPRHEEVRP